MLFLVTGRQQETHFSFVFSLYSSFTHHYKCTISTCLCVNLATSVPAEHILFFNYLPTEFRSSNCDQFSDSVFQQYIFSPNSLLSPVVLISSIVEVCAGLLTTAMWTLWVLEKCHIFLKEKLQTRVLNSDHSMAELQTLLVKHFTYVPVLISTLSYYTTKF